MRIKFQADADFNQNVVEAVHSYSPFIDFQTADEAGIRGLPDPDVLAFAASDNRILVSHDRKTMPTHFANFVANQPSPGVFLIAQKLSIGFASRELILIWEASEPDEWANKIKWLPL